MATEEKKAKIEELKDKFQRCKGLVVSDFRGLDANEMNQLRQNFTKEDIEYRVAKNTLARIAAEEAGFEGMEDVLQGPSGIAIGYDDPVLPFKISKDCENDFSDYDNKGGVLEGEVVLAEEVEAISQFSSRDDLLAQVARAFNGPIQQLAFVLKAKLQELVSVLNQVKDGKE